MKQSELMEPKNAAIEADAYTQQVYNAIANNLLKVQRKGRRVFILRSSFDRWKSNLRLRRQMRAEEHQAQQI